MANRRFEVRNKAQLLHNASSDENLKARRLVIQAIEASLASVDPKDLVKSNVTVRGDRLQVCQQSFDLSGVKDIYVIGGGKASGYMAEALEEILGGRIGSGVVNIPAGTKGLFRTEVVELREADHPIPSERGVAGVKSMLNIVSKASQDDLIICLISGGGSALMPLPRGKVTVEEKQILTSALLKAGASIREVNSVRKHLSRFKGGLLAKMAGAPLVCLIISDVVGDSLDVIASGPTAPDTSTFYEARTVLQRYGLWNHAPKSVRDVIEMGVYARIPETPKLEDPCFNRVHNFILGNNRVACSEAAEELRRRGVNALFLTSMAEGEAREYGGMVAAVVREICVSNAPVARPGGVVVGGETTVTVKGNGVGGRNQEAALSSALKLEGTKGVALAFVGTDGVDGPTDAAGALVDGDTLSRARDEGLDERRMLDENDSYHFFSKIGDLLFTGPTGTNVNDVAVGVAV